MKKSSSIIIILFVCIAFTAAMAAAGEKAPPKAYDLANGKLAAFGTDPAIVSAVAEKNAKGQSLADIQAMDKKWMDTPGIDDFMKSLMDSDCAKRLAAIQQAMPFIVEAFVMDNQGANVAMTDKTSDYWQGDEAKFKQSFNGGAGAVFVDEVKFDESTQAYLVQVSVPVQDGGKAIGAITFGIDVDKIQ
jgi:hypothetical protein